MFPHCRDFLLLSVTTTGSEENKISLKGTQTTINASPPYPIPNQSFSWSLGFYDKYGLNLSDGDYTFNAFQSILCMKINILSPLKSVIHLLFVTCLCCNKHKLDTLVHCGTIHLLYHATTYGIARWLQENGSCLR